MFVINEFHLKVSRSNFSFARSASIQPIHIVLAVNGLSQTNSATNYFERTKLNWLIGKSSCPNHNLALCTSLSAISGLCWAYKANALSFTHPPLVQLNVTEVVFINNFYELCRYCFVSTVSSYSKYQLGPPISTRPPMFQ